MFVLQAPRRLRLPLTSILSPRGEEEIGASHQEDALAARLAVEEAVGLLGLVERPAMGEEAVDVDLAVGDEAGAFGLADGREGPGAHQRHLAAQEVVADVERHRVALADEADLAPGPDAAHGIGARLRRGRGVEREMRAAP